MSHEGCRHLEALAAATQGAWAIVYAGHGGCEGRDQGTPGAAEGGCDHELCDDAEGGRLGDCAVEGEHVGVPQLAQPLHLPPERRRQLPVALRRANVPHPGHGRVTPWSRSSHALVTVESRPGHARVTSADVCW